MSVSEKARKERDGEILKSFVKRSPSDLVELSAEEQKKYWKDYADYLKAKARAELEQERKDAAAFARKQAEEDRKDRDHVLYIIAGQVVASHKEILPEVFREISGFRDFTDREIGAFGKLASELGIPSEDMPVFRRKPKGTGKSDKGKAAAAKSIGEKI